MVPGRPTGADDSMRADDSDGYLRPTPPIVIPPQRSAGKLQYGNEHDSGKIVCVCCPFMWSVYCFMHCPRIERPEAGVSLTPMYNVGHLLVIVYHVFYCIYSVSQSATF